MRKPIITLLLALGLLCSGAAVRAEDAVQLQDNPPDRYTVVKGDTLWEIAGKFLKQPWRWPEVWKMNRDAIKNPHLIYPGDVVVLDRSGASPQLRLVRADKYHGKSGREARATVKLSPRVRAESTADTAIPSIPPSAIGPFLSRPLALDKGALTDAPYILGTNEERVVMSAGDTIYASGLPSKPGERWQIYRPGKALVDPDTNEALAYEASYIGLARVVRPGQPATLEVLKTTQEINVNDRLIPDVEQPLIQYAPHPPSNEIMAKIISAYGSALEPGQFSTLVLNKGARDGLDVGTVLAVYERGRDIKLKANDPGGKTVREQPDILCLKPGKSVRFDGTYDTRDVYKTNCRSDANTVSLPGERSGLIFVYKVFDRVSYALVMRATRPIHLLDTATNPS